MPTTKKWEGNVRVDIGKIVRAGKQGLLLFGRFIRNGARLSEHVELALIPSVQAYRAKRPLVNPLSCTQHFKSLYTEGLHVGGDQW